MERHPHPHPHTHTLPLSPLSPPPQQQWPEPRRHRSNGLNLPAPLSPVQDIVEEEEERMGGLIAAAYPKSMAEARHRLSGSLSNMMLKLFYLVDIEVGSYLVKWGSRKQTCVHETNASLHRGSSAKKERILPFDNPAT
ncbi:hypothetical protein AKJ16_DCAP07506 [Drosera capensis]